MYARASHYLAEKAKSSIHPQNTEKSSKTVDPPLFDCIMASALPAQEKDAHRLAQEGFTVNIAGGDTTARILTLGIYHILANPPALKRMQDEIGTAMLDATKIPALNTLEDLPYLVYLSSNLAFSTMFCVKLMVLQAAFIKETLRIAAMPTSRLPMTTPGELIYEDWMIPPKVCIHSG